MYHFFISSWSIQSYRVHYSPFQRLHIRVVVEWNNNPCHYENTIKMSHLRILLYTFHEWWFILEAITGTVLAWYCFSRSEYISMVSLCVDRIQIRICIVHLCSHKLTLRLFRSESLKISAKNMHVVDCKSWRNKYLMNKNGYSQFLPKLIRWHFEIIGTLLVPLMLLLSVHVIGVARHSW